MITYAIVLILLRFATKYQNITLKHYYLSLKKVRPEGNTSVAHKKFLMLDKI